jgi:hypothetical protein
MRKLVTLVLLAGGTAVYFMVKNVLNERSLERKLVKGFIMLILIAILGFVLFTANRDMAGG